MRLVKKLIYSLLPPPGRTTMPTVEPSAIIRLRPLEANILAVSPAGSQETQLVVVVIFVSGRVTGPGMYAAQNQTVPRARTVCQPDRFHPLTTPAAISKPVFVNTAFES